MCKATYDGMEHMKSPQKHPKASQWKGRMPVPKRLATSKNVCSSRFDDDDADDEEKTMYSPRLHLPLLQVYLLYVYNVISIRMNILL